jgi:AcrR family transcriptional regulator
MVHTILDAAIVVLERGGVAGFNTNRVAEVAGISVGSLYQYFSNKEMLVGGIIERGVLDVDDKVRIAMKSARNVPPRRLLTQLLNELLASLEDYGDLLAEILAATPILSGTGVAAVLESRISDALRDFLVIHSGRYQLRGGPPALYTAVNGTIYVVLKWLAERPAFISRDELIGAFVDQLDALLDEVPA